MIFKKDNYYIVGRKRKISFRIKVLRFIVRYLIPVISIAATMVLADLFVFNYQTTLNIIYFISSLIGLATIATIISYLWFRLITEIQDKEDE